MNSWSQSEPDSKLIFCFYITLSGVDRETFRKCRECNRWFIHTSKREREFCSNKCAVRKASRKRREDIKKHQPEAYKKELEAGKQRAQKSYERKVSRKKQSKS